MNYKFAIPYETFKRGDRQVLEERDGLIGMNCKKKFFYEWTLTFSPNYWVPYITIDKIPDVLLQVVKDFARHIIYFDIAYSIEYHSKGSNKNPHIHIAICCYDEMLKSESLFSLSQKYNRKYGRNSLYFTGEEMRKHNINKNEGEPEIMGTWLDYLKKDVVKNEENGLKHYYEYCFQPH